jgi:16S rRNA (guanine(1405)-N(7))-methyltransferase
VETGKWNDLIFPPNWLFCFIVRGSETDLENKQLDQLVESILQNRKYRELDIPKETVMDLIQREMDSGLDEKTMVKNVRKKMHNIIAPYLGDPNYSEAITWLETAYISKNTDAIKQTCIQILSQHASTRERVSYLKDFYQQLFNLIGKPGSILDLACGLNPISLPWMELPMETEYHAYDIHTPRVKFINQFLILAGRQPLAEVRDILVNPPALKADVVFFFKEAHRLEQRRKGANRDLWQSLNVNMLLVSLPINSLNGQHDLSGQMRRLVENAIRGLSWSSQEIIIGNELVFCIHK